MLWEVFCEYGTPRILQSDNGTEFVNQVIRTLTVLHGIDHRLSSAYHPSTNGLVERRNKEVSRALKKFSEGTYALWSEWLSLVLLGLNEAISQYTGSSAFALMHGRRFIGFHEFSDVHGVIDLDKAFLQIKDVWTEFKSSIASN